MVELEAAADALVELESRAEVAEGERDAALAAGRALTPRPGLSAALPLAQRLGPAGAARLEQALQLFRCGGGRDCGSESCRQRRAVVLRHAAVHALSGQGAPHGEHWMRRGGSSYTCRMWSCEATCVRLLWCILSVHAWLYGDAL